MTADCNVSSMRVPSHGKGRLQSWQPGQSGNPGGVSPALREVTALAKQASPTVMRRLIEIAGDPSEDVRAAIVACQTILDRAFGKAKDGPPLPHETESLDLSHLDSAQKSELHAALEIVRSLSGREVGPAPMVQIYVPDNGR